MEQGCPQLEWHESLVRLLAASPELAAAQAEVGRANWALRRAVVEPKPNVNVQAGTQYDDATDYQIQFIQAGIAVPLFDRNQGNIRKAEAEIAAARADVARLELNLQSRLAVAFERYSNARQQVDLYRRQMLPNAKASHGPGGAGLQAGRVQLSDVCSRRSGRSHRRTWRTWKLCASCGKAPSPSRGCC